MYRRLLKRLYSFALLAFGCINTALAKVIFCTSSTGLEGETKPFQKPWFTTFAMFLGMSIVLLVFNLKPQLSFSSEEPLLPAKVNVTKSFLYLGVPACFDLVASGFMFLGLVFTPASSWQMLRSAEIIFCGLASVLFLKRRMLAFHYIGIVCSAIGVACVTVACLWAYAVAPQPHHGPPVVQTSVFAKMISNAITDAGLWNGSTETTALAFPTPIIGLTAILFGQAVAAAQMVAEEKLMKDVYLPPMQTIGLEGIWGMILLSMLFFPMFYFLPGNDAGSLESFTDSMVMLENNQLLLLLVLFFVCSCGIYNSCGMLITTHLSPVSWTIVEAGRTIVLWLVCLFAHYVTDPTSDFGEPWGVYSFLQLLGFMFLVLGHAIYIRAITLPCVGFMVLDTTSKRPRRSIASPHLFSRPPTDGW